MIHPHGVWSARFVVALAAIVVGPQLAAAGTASSGVADERPRLTFELDVMPILTAASCNSGGCHGKQRGQKGFQLSLLGFDADADFAALVHEGRGRRLSVAAPAESLLLQKATAEVSHGGGPRLQRDGPLYQVLARWIAEGMPRSGELDPVLERIDIAPQERTLQRGDRESLSVTARYSDGSTRDVTHLTTFLSNEPAIVAVDKQGRIAAGDISGEASIMARYLTEISTWNSGVAVEGKVDPASYEQLPADTKIDELVWSRLRDLNLIPSARCSDSVFLRRAHLDLIGRLPTPDEVRVFLSDEQDDKRRRLVDALLERPEYADFWATKWADLLRPNPYRVGIKATMSLDAWIRDVFRRNLPYDQWVRQLVTAKGSTWRNGSVTLFRDRRAPDEMTTIVSQLFLGVRLECAKCHHHPFEVWGQDHFYRLAAFFSRVGRKGVGLSPPISGGEEIVFASESGAVRHPLTGETLAPKPLHSDAPEIGADQDPREALADWMVSPDNEYFAKAGANRVWSELMGRGLVEPVDDMRITNPPSNGPLLDALADLYREVEFDQKRLLREIANSYVYQLSSLPNDRNVGDVTNYSRHYRRQLSAEVLLDMVSDVTGIPDEYTGRGGGVAVPRGSRATEAWTFRTDSLFLDAFGRPDPNQDPPCERLVDSTVVQALHLMNAPRIQEKVSADDGQAARLAASELAPREIITELYLATYSRFPTEQELAELEGEFGDEAQQRRQATEDIMWSLINTPEFMLSD